MGHDSTFLRLSSWLGSRRLELAVFLLGVLLRCSMAWSYDQAWTYDADGHWAVVEWILAHHEVPPVEAVLHAFHPPLYYSLAALLVEHGVSRADLVWVSIACGTLRLALIWTALELYVRTRIARVAALALAAVLASSVHLDGMVYPEALSGLWLAAAMLFVPLAFHGQVRTRWRLAGVIGLLLGLAMLTKISGLVVIAAIGAAALIELLLSRRTLSARVADALHWLAMLAIVVAISGWYFARNVRDYGRPFVTSFDLPSQHQWIVPFDDVPMLDRRSAGFFLSWDPAINVWPYYPAGIKPYPRFFPLAIASTFIDYWNFSFSGLDPMTARTPMRDWSQNRPISPPLLRASRYAVAGGMVIFVATVAAWCAALRACLRRRDFGGLALLFVPALTLLTALQFATVHPVDHYGVVKGVYMQFGAPPMYALFGLAVGWSAAERRRWPLLGLLCLAFWLVATYTLWCRLRVPLLPLG
jgi:hypothetical protein